MKSKVPFHPGPHFSLETVPVLSTHTPALLCFSSPRSVSWKRLQHSPSGSVLLSNHRALYLDGCHLTVPYLETFRFSTFMESAVMCVFMNSSVCRVNSKKKWLSDGGYVKNSNIHSRKDFQFLLPTHMSASPISFCGLLP